MHIVYVCNELLCNYQKNIFVQYLFMKKKLSDKIFHKINFHDSIEFLFA